MVGVEEPAELAVGEAELARADARPRLRVDLLRLGAPVAQRAEPAVAALHVPLVVRLATEDNELAG